MTNQIRNPNEGGFVRLVLLIVFSLGALAACCWAAGISLGLFLGGLFAATFLTPAGVLGLGNFRRAIGGFAAVVAPVAIIWILPVLKGADTPGQWMQTMFVLITYAAAIGGIALVLTRMGSPMVFAAAAAVLVGLAWLTWPIWLSAILVRGGSGPIVQRLVAVSPPLAINGILIHEPAWTEQSLAYHLTNLNQDVPIQLPAGAGTCATVHGILGLLLWSAAMFRRKELYAAGSCEDPGNPLTVRPNG